MLRSQVSEWAILALLQHLQGWRQPHLLGIELLAGRLVSEAVDHVPLCRLSIVALVVLGIRPLVHIALVSIGAAVAMQVPLQKRHGLHVHKLIVDGGANDVRVAHAYSSHVRGDLHAAPRLHEGPQGAEEEAHQVLMPPVYHGVAVEESLDGAGVWEVVVHCPKGLLHPLESRVDCNARAVHPVVDLGEMILEDLDARVDLLVALAEDLDGLEGRGDDPPDVAQALAVLREQEGEREVGVAQH
mmetsp:Transcript_95157/g.213117  ORF Transcript_95157/g.213117 Transcript_95157/m.213117 type:complete len:243 (-) Transcript_95157:358-1086(-)